MNKETETYICPKCQSGLLSDARNNITCKTCGKSWDSIQGIPNFIDEDTFWAEPGFTRENLQKINESLEVNDWNKVLANHEVSEIRRMYKFLSDYGRINWLDLLDLPYEVTVLDLGAGMGTMSQALSKRCKKIYAVEPVRERVDFMRHRFRQEKCNNIEIIRSDIDNLPFEKEKFDLIILNGVLEWLPFNKKDMNPRKVQKYYLEMLKELIKQDGHIYVGIENRTSYSLFLGAPDPHIGYKYVTFLPRWVSHIICKLKSGDIYRPYLYTSAGYKKLLEESGYQTPEIYSALPSYNEPNHINNIKTHSVEFKNLILTSKRSSAKFAQKILISMNLLKYLGYAYIIFGKKNT